MDSEISSNVLIALRKIMRAVDLNSKKLHKRHKLTVPQLILLKEIAARDEIPIGSLAKSVSLSSATVTGIVDRLEKQQLAERIRGSNDRRQVLVKSTSAGKELLKNAPSPLQEEFVKAFESLNLTEQKNIMNALETVAKIMDAEHLDVAPLLDSGPISGNGRQIDHNGQ